MSNLPWPPRPIALGKNAPSGAFPIPWGNYEREEEEAIRRGRGMYGRNAPSGAFPIPWGRYDLEEEENVRRMNLYGRGMGQAGPTCEVTDEGGKRCSDGTYYAPGCPTTGPGIPGAAPSAGIPLGYLAAGAAAVVGGALLLAGRRMGAETALETSYPAAAEQLRSIAIKINGERANDAYWFPKYIDASKRRQDLVFAEGDAEKKLAEQQRIWEAAHRNLDALQAAQAAFDAIQSQKAAAGAERDEGKAGIESAQANIATYRHNAGVIISGLPAEFQTEARRIIDPCYGGGASMQGRAGRIPVRPMIAPRF